MIISEVFRVHSFFWGGGGGGGGRAFALHPPGRAPGEHANMTHYLQLQYIGTIGTNNLYYIIYYRNKQYCTIVNQITFYLGVC